MATLNLRPGHVYFLTMEDAAGERDFPFYKIGTTEGRVAERIDQLQTGNPFRIIAHHAFWSEAAQMVEQHLHKRCARNGVRLEWFRFDEESLRRVIEEAESFSNAISPVAERVRDHDARCSNGCVVDPDAPARALHAEAVDLLGEIVQRRAELSCVEYALRVDTGNSLGIEGVTRFRVIAPPSAFRQQLLEEHHAELAEAFRSREELVCSFRFEERPRITSFPELHERLRQARQAVPRLGPSDVRDRWRPRDERAVALHEEYLALRSALSALEGDLRLLELRLRDRCGENEGVRGICSYRRRIEKKLDVNALRAAHPEVWAACLEAGAPQLRFSIVPSRDYA